MNEHVPIINPLVSMMTLEVVGVSESRQIFATRQQGDKVLEAQPSTSIGVTVHMGLPCGTIIGALVSTDAYRKHIEPALVKKQFDLSEAIESSEQDLETGA